MKKTIVVGITGASGALYAERLFVHLAGYAGVTLHVLVTEWGRRVFHEECGKTIEDALPVNAVLDNIHTFDVSYASGSAPADGVIIIPMSMNTLAKVAAGIADTLLLRAADVALKERRPLVLVPRETPLTLTHIENMARVTRAGGTIIPAMPSFYTAPHSIEALVDTVVFRVIEHAGIPLSHPRYQGG